MGAVVLASAAPVAYVAGFALFKTTASRMPRLTGARPLHTTRHLALNPVWLWGLTTLIIGLVSQSLVMTRLPVSVVVPMYGPVMAVLLLVSVSNFGERVTSGERRALTVLLMALLAFAAAGGLLTGDSPTEAGPWDASVPLWKLSLVVVPSLLIPLWLFTVRDKPVDGRHAKRVTGVAFGLGAGVVVGLAESSGASIARIVNEHPWRLEPVLASPHPYIVVVAGLLGAGLAQIGLQRCRLSVVIIVLAVGSKASLWLTGILVYGQPWPKTPGAFLLSGVGLILAAWSVLLIPRHESEPAPTTATVESGPAPRPAPRPARPVLATELAAPVPQPVDVPDPSPGTDVHPPATADPVQLGVRRPVWRLR
ncbi:hypothetical protein SMC26_03350 [Actinomadura fulvescens]|uniref:Integral membrane protein n=1 Tax=Actinomadura fulvescens TaxID=46160 RepID=A0ABN3PXD4_9ACTN